MIKREEERGKLRKGEEGKEEDKRRREWKRGGGRGMERGR